ncbi:hypothetical protein, partial [Sedimentibacter sp. B4]|uniref:hypothetical protein n=1 Tax=Sedimentibacter sp. B4 TaxID=304766 RepID=UPI001E4FD3F8
SREKTLEAQDKQQAITDASKDAANATADAIPLSTVAQVDVVKAPATVTRVDGTRRHAHRELGGLRPGH